ncbi:MAG: hypothetical protein ABI716_00445 [Candidatus Saccharibacteria bacterium]
MATFLAIFLVLSVSFIFCAKTTSALSQNSKGLTVSPLRSELEIAPGTSLDGGLMVTNSTDKPMKVSLNAEEFSVINQQYDYAFTEESGVASWVTFASNEVSLAAGESQKVLYRVGAPLSAEPGGRYISLFAATDSQSQSEGISSRQRIASLLYITVNGDVSRIGQLVSLSSPWVINGDSRWSVVLRNSGTTHFRSRYSAQLQNLLNHNIDASMSGDALILPGTVRAVTGALPAPKLPGFYKAIYTIGLGDTPAKIETRIVLYMPPAYGVLVMVMISLVLAVSIGRFLRRR